MLGYQCHPRGVVGVQLSVPAPCSGGCSVVSAIPMEWWVLGCQCQSRGEVGAQVSVPALWRGRCSGVSA